MSDETYDPPPHRSDDAEKYKANSNGLHKDNLISDVMQALEGMEFGEIKIIVRDGRIMQIERTTRNRPSTNRKPRS